MWYAGLTTPSRAEYSIYQAVFVETNLMGLAFRHARMVKMTRRDQR